MGFYILGQRGQGAGVLPPEGVFFSLPSYYYSGDSSSSEELPFNGTADQGIDAELFIVMPTALWVTPVNVFGGDLAFSGNL